MKHIPLLPKSCSARSKLTGLLPAPPHDADITLIPFLRVWVVKMDVSGGDIYSCHQGIVEKYV